MATDNRGTTLSALRAPHQDSGSADVKKKDLRQSSQAEQDHQAEEKHDLENPSGPLAEVAEDKEKHNMETLHKLIEDAADQCKRKRAWVAWSSTVTTYIACITAGLTLGAMIAFIQARAR